jgi:MFS family permease
MGSMNEEATPTAPISSPEPSHKDRRTGLIVFGILQILLGLLGLGMAALIPVSMSIAHQTDVEPMPMRVMVPGLMMYFCWGVMFIWLGIGSAQCRRWARALILIYSWLWLILGIVVVPMMAWLLPRIMSSLPETNQEMPEGMMGIIIVTQIVFMALFFIVLPSVLVLFYRSRHVKATCELRDPVRRWTDNCPLPLLAVTCMMSLSSLLMLVLPFTGMAMFPFFGTLLTGLPGSILVVGIAGFMFWIGWSFYRQKIAGWWALLVMMVVFGISNYVTFSRIDAMEIYRKMDYPQSQIDLIEQQGWFTSDFMMWNALIWVVPMLLYLLWIKRFFRATNPAE